jgi:hypothetical protein
VVDDLSLEEIKEDKVHPLWKIRVLKPAGLMTNVVINLLRNATMTLRNQKLFFLLFVIKPE